MRLKITSISNSNFKHIPNNIKCIVKGTYNFILQESVLFSEADKNLHFSLLLICKLGKKNRILKILIDISDTLFLKIVIFFHFISENRIFFYPLFKI